LFLITLLSLPLYAIVVWGFKKPYQNVNRKMMEQSAKVQSNIVESLSGAFTIKAFNGQETVKLEAEHYLIDQVKTIFQSVWLQNIHSALHGLLVSLGDLALLWVGADLVMQGTISLGQLLTFNALSGYFTGPVKNLIGLQFVLQEAYVASERLGEILDLEIEELNEAKKVKLNHLKGDVEFKKVDFRYGARELVLKEVNLKIKPQERIAFIGASGSGKTTLVKLLLKYYLPEKGEILIDSYNIQDIDIESLRNRIGYVPQEIFLFSGSISENIAFGNENTTFEEIIAAAKQSQAHEFINELPLRYDTLIGDITGNNNTAYRVEGTVGKTRLYDKKGVPAYLKVGMLCEARVIVKRKKLLDVVLEKLDFR
jgi:ABC-type bacteriocin/lantibiotic exporter with double-glycine peptidase domain